MLAAHGVYGHIRNNDVRAAVLLAAFAVYIGLLWVAACLFFSAIGIEIRVVSVQLETGHQLQIPHWLFALETAEHVAVSYAWVPALFAVGWLIYAYMMRRQLVRAGTRAESTSRSLEPQFYNIVETLAISAGLPMPAIEIIETDALNAYASGWTPADAVVGVTRGLLRSLSKDELEAVLAHEITHVRHRDVRLMTVAAIFVGFLASGARAFGAGKDGASTRNLALRTSGGAGILFIAAAAVIGALVSALGRLSQLAISRSREFVADAGAVQLTKNPDALISALKKIAAHGDMLAVPGALRAMLIFSLPEGWRATHPSIESRIAALETFAGGGRAVVSTPSSSKQPNLHRAGLAAGGAARSRDGNETVRPFGRRARV